MFKYVIILAQSVSSTHFYTKFLKYFIPEGHVLVCISPYSISEEAEQI
jgi:hypothetical protein